MISSADWVGVATVSYEPVRVLSCSSSPECSDPLQGRQSDG